MAQVLQLRCLTVINGRIDLELWHPTRRDASFIAGSLVLRCWLFRFNEPWVSLRSSIGEWEAEKDGSLFVINDRVNCHCYKRLRTEEEISKTMSVMDLSHEMNATIPSTSGSRVFVKISTEFKCVMCQIHFLGFNGHLSQQMCTDPILIPVPSLTVLISEALFPLYAMVFARFHDSKSFEKGMIIDWPLTMKEWEKREAQCSDGVPLAHSVMSKQDFAHALITHGSDQHTYYKVRRIFYSDGNINDELVKRKDVTLLMANVQDYIDLTYQSRALLALVRGQGIKQLSWLEQVWMILDTHLMNNTPKNHCCVSAILSILDFVDNSFDPKKSLYFNNVLCPLCLAQSKHSFLSLQNQWLHKREMFHEWMTVEKYEWIWNDQCNCFCEYCSIQCRTYDWFAHCPGDGGLFGHYFCFECLNRQISGFFKCLSLLSECLSEILPLDCISELTSFVAGISVFPKHPG